MKILVVDDNQEDLALLKEVLSFYGYATETASNGVEALEKVLQNGFDIIISDILMPGMDGFQLCRAIKMSKKLKSIAFVFYTATYTSPEDAKFALSQGADEFILKPQEPREFIEILRKIIKSHEAGKIKSAIQPEEKSAYFKHYSERLIKKLNDKLQKLEMVNRALAAEKERLAMTLQAKERLAMTIRSMSDVVITTDRQGRIVLINEVAQEFTGWMQTEAIGRSLPEIFSLVNERTGKKCEDIVEKVIRTGQHVDLDNDTILVTRDGAVKRVIIAGNAAPLKDNEGNITGLVMVLQDVTEKKRREEELQKISKLESLGLLAGGIAHDFNNILTIIVGNISVAKLYIDPEDTKFPLLDDVERAALWAKSLTNRLLTFARGGAPIRRTVSLAPLIKEWAQFALRGSRTRCDFSIQENLWPVEIDEGQMSQGIHNLIVNADQAMPEGGTIQVWAENQSLETERIVHGVAIPAGRYVVISIQDQGVGIPKEHLNKIFDPYFTTKETGIGLGLTVSYSIVKRHGGYLAVESEPGEGTTFFVYLPMSVKEKEIRKKVPAVLVEKKEKPLPGEGKILVMEDEEMLRRYLYSLLSSLGYEVVCIGNGDEAIKSYQDALKAGHPFDAVIMDLTIPGGMGGDVAIQKLIEIDPGTKAIVSSGYSTDPIMTDFRQHGFKGCIPKPYDIQTLSRVLHEVVDKN
ncbi:MAG: response regulator [bacterium]